MNHDKGGVLIGDYLDGLNVRADMRPGQRLVGVLVIGKLIDLESDADPLLLIASHEGSDWIDRRGLLHAAREVFEGITPQYVADEED